MRVMLLVFIVTAALLAACTPAGGGVVTEPEGSTPESPALGAAGADPTGTGAYPAPPDSTTEGGYPAMPAAPTLADGYPGTTLVPPSGTVDLASLTPGAPELTPQEMPNPGSPDESAAIQGTPLWDAIVADLSAYLEVPAGEIQLVSAVARTWPNGGLGCPAEGMAYTDMIVEGYLVTLQAAGNAYTYHTSGLTTFVHCQNGAPVSAGSAP